MAHESLDPARWVDQHGDLMYRYALLRLGTPEAAENVVQETFVAGLKGLESFSGRSSERTWLMGIMKHKIIDHFRKRARELPTEDIEAVAEERESFEDNGKWKVGPRRWRAPDETLEAADFWKAVQLCVHQLPERLAMAFTLREMDQLDSKEACKILGVTPTNLGVMMHRARMRLRSCLELGWFADEGQ